MTITVAAAVALSITTASPLPAGTVGTAYSQTFASTGGTGTKTWSVSAGPLPAGLALSAAGVLSGTPTAAATSSFTVQVTGGGTATKAFSVTINPAAVALSITTASPLPAGTVGTAYSQTFASTGGTGTKTWSVSAGTVPAGLNLSAAGVLGGTPTAAGTSSFTVQVTGGGTATKAFSLTINAVAAPTISTVSPLPAGTVGTAYSQTLAATGGTMPYGWSVSSGTVPAGLNLSAAGVLGGTPTAAGTSSFTVQVTGANSASSTKAFSVTINAVAAPTISTVSPLPAGTVGTAYSQTLAATGGTMPYGWSVSSGTVPAGLNLSAAGVLGGTPAAAGTSSFTVQVTGANSASSTKAFSVTINLVTQTGAVTITPADGATDVPVNTVITARIGSGDIRAIFNKDTFTLKPGVATGDSSVGLAEPLSASVCVTGGFVQGLITYNDSHTRARFTPNCPLQHNMTFIGEIASAAGSSSAAPQIFRFTTAVAHPDSDGDGGDDGEDNHPQDNRRTGVSSPYGTGTVVIEAVNTAGPTISGAMAISEASSRLNQAGAPVGYEFPDGLVSFQAQGVAQGTSATFKVTFPSGIAAGSKVYQADTNGFHEVVGAVVAGDTVTLTVTNADAQGGGVPVNPVGVAAPASSGTGSVDLTSASGGGGCSVAARTGSGGSDVDGTLILAGLGLTAWGIRRRRRKG